jgi:hypothetical protein
LFEAGAGGPIVAVSAGVGLAGCGVEVSVAVGVSVQPAISVRMMLWTTASTVAPGWKGVAVAVALGSAVTRSGGAAPYAGAAGAHAASRRAPKMQRIPGFRVLVPMSA